jgi:tellurium resistance protein TerD
MLFLSKNIAADFLGELTLLRHPEPSVFMVGDTGKVLSDAGFIFFNNKISACGSLTHMGDIRTGTGDGDDEQVKIDLAKIPADVKKLVFAVTIHEAEARKQNFGMVSNSFMRVFNNDNGTEIARFDLSEDASTETAMVFGELYRHNDEWKFKAVGQGFAGGLSALETQHGVNIYTPFLLYSPVGYASGLFIIKNIMSTNMATKKNDADVKFFFSVVAFLIFIPFMAFAYLHYRNLKSRYVTNKNVQRIVDIGRLYAAVGTAIAALAISLGMFWFISAMFTKSTAGTSFSDFVFPIMLVIYVLVMVYPLKKLADAAGTAYLGVILDDSSQTLIFPADLANCSASDIVKLRFLEGLGSVDMIPLTQISSFTREKGRLLHIQGDFGSRALSFSNKQKRDECLSALQRRIKFRGSRDLGY